MAFRAAVLEAYLAECCFCGFSLRLVDGLIGVDAAHPLACARRPDEVPNGLALCALHHRLFDHGAITVREDLRVRVARALRGSSARDLFKKFDGQPVRPPVDQQFYLSVAYGTAPDWIALSVGLLGLVATLFADARYLRRAIARRHFRFLIDRAILLMALAIVAGIWLWRLIYPRPP